MRGIGERHGQAAVRIYKPRQAARARVRINCCLCCACSRCASREESLRD